ncbi:hypothetical protein [Haladaptatus caseinilyticus]|uniref:hypothetical protein n=1 Tax=Haladaptatus caseinilyticus TaxID=2993314 RepID=UPI00224B7EB9|nr:hypothetical protein [Haladaptatus caseinilyticus]
MVEKYRFDLLPNTKTCYRYLQVGLGIILFTFVVLLGTVLIPSIDETASAVGVLTMPSLFVGLGLILFGIGTHLHIMHLNILRQMSDDEIREGKED